MTKRTVVLAHYYTIPEVQQMADFVGDSLDLSLAARDAEADRIVFAGVRFMAETAKILNPDVEVLLPSSKSTCSLVEETDLEELTDWIGSIREGAAKTGQEVSHVMYINSSVEMKTLADIIVTSRNVEEIIAAEKAKGKLVAFSPDYNMGQYINHVNGWDMPVWSATCEVHEKFNVEALEKEYAERAEIPILIAHPESTLGVLNMADFVGSTSKMLQYVKDFDLDPGGTVIFVATEDGILHNMREARPELTIEQAPVYSGCQCNSCFYMKLNTVRKVDLARIGFATPINYISDELREKALIPINRMLEFT